MNTNRNTKPQLVVALDNCMPAEAAELVKELRAAGVEWFKVGLELFTQSGPQLVRDLKNSGARVFLDLKLHDIPNTISMATKAAVQLGVDLLTVHASGGLAMLRAAREAASGSSLKIVAVTVLTSLDELEFESVAGAWGAALPSQLPRGNVAYELAKLACLRGMDGIVCSVSDLHDGQLRRLPWGHAPILVTPGIRNAGYDTDDQKSVASIEQAVKAGSTHLVVGRPINALPQGSRGDRAREFLEQIREAYAVQTNS